MVKVCVVGAAGGIGQPLSLLLKLNVKITQLSLYDVNPLVAGVAADVSHINTPAQVRSCVRLGGVPGGLLSLRNGGFSISPLFMSSSELFFRSLSPRSRAFFLVTCHQFLKLSAVLFRNRCRRRAVASPRSCAPP